jgi:GWxTD domain-containing protein
MKPLKYAIVAALYLFIAGVLVGQTFPARERMRIQSDITRYRGGDDENTHVEVAYAFPERSISYKADSAGLTGAVDVTLKVYLKDSLVAADRWLVPHSIADTALLKRDMSLVGLYAVQLPEGDYLFRIIGRDRYDPSRRDSLSLKVPVRRFPTAKPVLSDVELASTIRQGSKGSIFYKNTLEVVPNVGGLYTEEQKVFYYSEAYNLIVPGDTSEYYVRTNVYDAVGKEIVSRERPKKRLTESSVIVDQFAVKNLRTGTYTLLLSLLDSARTPLSSNGRKFFVYNQTLGIDSSLLASSTSLPMPQYMSMDESELDREFDWSRYSAMDDEKSQFAKLGKAKNANAPADAKAIVDAKRKFMSDFWRHRELGLREEYLSRVAYANANFHVLSRDGYRTDRGRVTIMYGMPDDIERHPNETETRPYEIWNYNNIQGGVIFVFVLRNAAGDYELVHSTHRNELHDENWDRVGITR